MNTDAYAAGILDGEGCIYVGRGQRSGGRKGRAFYAVVEVGMTQKAGSVLAWLKTNYGGNIYDSREATERWDAAKVWHLHGGEAAEMLRRTLPWLLLKREQARLAIKVQEMRESLVPKGGKHARWTDEAVERCETMHKTIHELNRTGPAPSLDPPMPGATLTALRVGGEWVTPQRDLFSETGWEKWSGTWPSSGMGSAGGFWTVNTSTFPSDGRVCSLSEVLETGPVPPKYYLSRKAAQGILDRAARRRKTLPPRLEEALQEVAAGRTPTE